MKTPENQLVTFLQEIISPIISESVRKSLAEFQQTAQAEQQPEYWDIQAAASFLHLSKATIYRLTSKSLIPYHKTGKKLYFKRKEILHWLEAGRVFTHQEYQEKSEQKLAKRR